MKTLIVARVHETAKFAHFVAYVIDKEGKQDLVTPFNATAHGGKIHTYRHSFWDSPREKAVRACRKEAQRLGHGDHYLVVHVTGYHESAKATDSPGYNLETA